jgi:hypothetical protein
MEGGAEGVPDDLEDMAIVCLNGGAQNGVMACPQRLPGITLFLGEFGAALDVGEQEGDGAGGKIRAHSIYSIG